MAPVIITKDGKLIVNRLFIVSNSGERSIQVECDNDGNFLVDGEIFTGTIDMPLPQPTEEYLLHDSFAGSGNLSLHAPEVHYDKYLFVTPGETEQIDWPLVDGYAVCPGSVGNGLTPVLQYELTGNPSYIIINLKLPEYTPGNTQWSIGIALMIGLRLTEENKITDGIELLIMRPADQPGQIGMVGIVDDVGTEIGLFEVEAIEPGAELELRFIERPANGGFDCYVNGTLLVGATSPAHFDGSLLIQQAAYVPDTVAELRIDELRIYGTPMDPPQLYRIMEDTPPDGIPYYGDIADYGAKPWATSDGFMIMSMYPSWKVVKAVVSLKHTTSLYVAVGTNANASTSAAVIVLTKTATPQATFFLSGVEMGTVDVNYLNADEDIEVEVNCLTRQVSVNGTPVFSLASWTTENYYLAISGTLNDERIATIRHVASYSDEMTDITAPPETSAVIFYDAFDGTGSLADHKPNNGRADWFLSTTAPETFADWTLFDGMASVAVSPTDMGGPLPYAQYPITGRASGIQMGIKLPEYTGGFTGYTIGLVAVFGMFRSNGDSRDMIYISVAGSSVNQTVSCWIYKGGTIISLGDTTVSVLTPGNTIYLNVDKLESGEIQAKCSGTVLFTTNQISEIIGDCYVWPSYYDAEATAGIRLTEMMVMGYIPYYTGIDITTPSVPMSVNSLIRTNQGVLVGIDDGRSTAMVSLDKGVTWAEKTMPSTNDWYDLCSCYGLYLIACATDSDKFARSADNGETWTEVTVSANVRWRAVGASGSTVIAVSSSGVGSGSTVATRSTDSGQTWAALTMPAALEWQSIAGDSDTFIAAAGNSNQIARSTDKGVTWELITLPEEIIGYSITACGAGTFAIIDYGGNKVWMTHDNGSTWEGRIISDTSRQWYDIDYAPGGILVAVCIERRVAVSMDRGRTWKEFEFATGGSYASITWADHDIFVVGAMDSPNAKQLTFTEG